jgi:hypothetical protein
MFFNRISIEIEGLRKGDWPVPVAAGLRRLEHLPDKVHQSLCEQIFVCNFNFKYFCHHLGRQEAGASPRPVRAVSGQVSRKIRQK